MHKRCLLHCPKLYSNGPGRFCVLYCAISSLTLSLHYVCVLTLIPATAIAFEFSVTSRLIVCCTPAKLIMEVKYCFGEVNTNGVIMEFYYSCCARIMHAGCVRYSVTLNTTCKGNVSKRLEHTLAG